MDNDIVGRLRRAAQPKNVPRRIKIFDNAADEIERLRQQNAELVEALRCFLALETPHTWLYKRNKAEALIKESLSTELFNELQSNRR